VPGDVQAAKRTYGFTASVLAALAAVALAVGIAAGNPHLEFVAPVVAGSLSVLVFSVGIVHRPRAFLTLFGDEDEAERDRYVLACCVVGGVGVAVALFCLAMSTYLVSVVAELPQVANDPG
jgi:hypothetical protein